MWIKADRCLVCLQNPLLIGQSEESNSENDQEISQSQTRHIEEDAQNTNSPTCLEINVREYRERTEKKKHQEDN